MESCREEIVNVAQNTCESMKKVYVRKNTGFVPAGWTIITESVKCNFNRIVQEEHFHCSHKLNTYPKDEVEGEQ